MSTTLPNIGLKTDYVDGQDDWGTEVNNNFKAIDDLIHIKFDSIVAVLPGSSTAGTAFILSTNKTVNVWNGTGWNTHTPKVGWQVIDEDGNEYYFDGTDWIEKIIDPASIVGALVNAQIPAANVTGTLSLSQIAPIEVEDLDDVDITNRTNGTVIYWDSVSSTHKYKSVDDAYVVTSAPIVTTAASRTIFAGAGTTTITLHTPVGNGGQKLIIRATGEAPLISGTILDRANIKLFDTEAITLLSNNVNWVVIERKLSHTINRDLNTGTFGGVWSFSGANDYWVDVGFSGGIGPQFDRDLILTYGKWRIFYQVNLVTSRLTYDGSASTNVAIADMNASNVPFNNGANGSIVTNSISLQSFRMDSTINSHCTNHTKFVDVDVNAASKNYRLVYRQNQNDTDYISTIDDSITGTLTNPDTSNNLYAIRIDV